MYNIILAEDQNIVRHGIKMLLNADDDFKVVGEGKNGIEALDIVKSGVKVDIVLADINMPAMGGIELISELKVISPEIYVVVLSMLDNESYINQAFNQGACGYLLKTVSADELIFALKHIAKGNKYLCSELSIHLLDKFLKKPIIPNADGKPPIEFSMREIEILQLIAEGLTNTEMSQKLFISKRTIEGHRLNLLEKTGSRNTATLIKFAFLNDYLS